MNERAMITDWHNCYDGSWKGLIVDAAFQHPAKFARGLIERIIDHGLEKGYWKRGDLVGDPFGGVGLGGITCASKGIRWIGVELESTATGGTPFVELGQQNFELHRRMWEEFGDPLPVLVQGDSRHFAEIVAGAVDAVVTSPPYAEGQGHGGAATPTPHDTKGTAAAMEVGYGLTPGQIGALKSGSLDAIVTSPPYAETVKGDHGETETAEESRAKRVTAGGSLGQSQRHGGYGVTAGQIGALRSGDLDAVVTSPPFADSNTKPTKMGEGKGTRADGDGAGRNKGDYHYPESPGQIGALKEGVLDGAVTSPPYENSMESGDGKSHIDFSKCADGRKWKHSKGNQGSRSESYGRVTPGQIGNEAAETYWLAMKTVYAQMHVAMKPGAVAAIVVKDYVKQKKRVPLCDQTCQLLESLGFTVFERTRAWLVKETRHPDLFGGEDHVKTKSRKSFFRRLCERKGSPRIDWEEILWCRKIGG